MRGVRRLCAVFLLLLARRVARHPFGAAQEQAQRFARRLDLLRVLVGIHPPGEFDAVAFNAVRGQPGRVAARRPIARLVRVVGQPHPWHLLRNDRVEQLLGKAFRAVDERHVRKAVHVEGERVKRRFAQDQLPSRQRGHVPNADVRPRQIQMQRRALAQIVQNLAPVHPHRLAVRAQDRHHQRAVEMFVAALPNEPQLLQPLPNRHALGSVAVRHPQPQRPIGKPQPKLFDGRFVVYAAFLEVGQRGGSFQQPLVVVVHHLREQLGIARVRRKWNRQPWNRRLAHRFGLSHLERRRAALGQQLVGVPETHAVKPLHKLDDVARRAAAHAVKQALARTRDE